MSVLESLGLVREKPRCGTSGPGPDRCLMGPGHEGWHKSNHHGWPNEAESLSELDACSECGVPITEHPDTDACAIRSEQRDPWWVGRRDRDQLTGAYNPEAERRDPLTGQWH